MTKEYKKYCTELVADAKLAITIVPTSKLLSNKKKRQWLDIASKQLNNYSKELRNTKLRR